MDVRDVADALRKRASARSAAADDRKAMALGAAALDALWAAYAETFERSKVLEQAVGTLARRVAEAAQAAPPVVALAAGAITVNVEPKVEVELPPRRTETTVERDRDGNIVRATQVARDE